MGVRGGVGAERAEGAFPGRMAHPRSRSDPWAQIQMNSELVGALSGSPALISPNFTEKTDASALRGRVGETHCGGRAGGSRHGAGRDARTAAVGLPVDCGPRGRRTDTTGAGSHWVREACVCVCVCVGKAGEAVMVVVCGVSAGEDNWGDVEGRGTRNRGVWRAGPGGATVRLSPHFHSQRALPHIPTSSLFLTPSSPDASLYLLYTKIPLIAPNCLHSPMKRLSNSHHFG